MNEFLVYLLKVSLLSTIFLITYELLFRRLTYFNFNRIYLVGSLTLAFIIPLLQIQVWTQIVPGSILNNTFGELGITLDNPWGTFGSSGGFTLSTLWVLLYWAGFIWVLFQSVKFFWEIRKIKTYNPTVKKGSNRIVVTEDHPSFSFFGWIFIRQNVPSVNENPILVHEMAHSRQFHSLDLLYFEIMQAVLWFNPIAWLYKKRIREVHEFLADQEVVKSGISVCDYIRSIQEEIMHNRSHRLASHFKSSTLKKRLLMVMKTDPSRSWWKYLLILPIVSIGLVLFSFTTKVDTPTTPEKDPPSISPIEKADIKKIAIDFGEEFVDPFTKETRKHTGIDFAAKVGTPVHATSSAIVKHAGKKGDLGNIVLLVHDDHFSSLYAHLDEIKVKDGQKIKKGQVIGTVGETGKTTGPHLHYEVWLDGKPIHPKKAQQIMVKAYESDENSDKAKKEAILKKEALKKKQALEEKKKAASKK